MSNTLLKQNFEKKTPVTNLDIKSSSNLSINTKSNKAILVGSASNNSKNLILASTSSDNFIYNNAISSGLDLIKNFDIKV